MSVRKYGYTFLGRYNILDRGSGNIEHDWYINKVFKQFGSEISKVISLGCSVGINEVLLGINNPDTYFIASDIDSDAICVANSGVWNLDDIRPSGFALASIDEKLQELYEYFCPKEYFKIDFQRGTLKLLRSVPNVKFQEIDAKNTELDDDSFDMVITHMLGGENCFPYDQSYVKLGNEIKRILKPEGFFWNETGLFKKRNDTDSSQFYRILKKKDTYEMESSPTSIEYLFPGSFKIHDKMICIR
ncbi:Methyltransferase domain protein [uncultured archaeon]|nr:Methyltransferase domain protein [uncultured archaeon]